MMDNQWRKQPNMHVKIEMSAEKKNGNCTHCTWEKMHGSLLPATMNKGLLRFLWICARAIQSLPFFSYSLTHMGAAEKRMDEWNMCVHKDEHRTMDGCSSIALAIHFIVFFSWFAYIFSFTTADELLNVKCVSLYKWDGIQNYVHLCYSYNMSYSRIDWISFLCVHVTWIQRPCCNVLLVYGIYGFEIFCWPKLCFPSQKISIAYECIPSFVSTCTQFSSTFIYLLFHVRYHNSFLYSLQQCVSSLLVRDECIKFRRNKKCRSKIWR